MALAAGEADLAAEAVHDSGSHDGEAEAGGGHSEAVIALPQPREGLEQLPRLQKSR